MPLRRRREAGAGLGGGRRAQASAEFAGTRYDLRPDGRRGAARLPPRRSAARPPRSESGEQLAAGAAQALGRGGLGRDPMDAGPGGLVQPRRRRG